MEVVAVVASTAGYTNSAGDAELAGHAFQQWGPAGHASQQRGTLAQELAGHAFLQWGPAGHASQQLGTLALVSAGHAKQRGTLGRACQGTGVRCVQHTLLLGTRSF